MDYRELSNYLTGQWEEALNMYGIEIPQMKGKNSKNHACPCCGGTDRAHWREVEGRLALYCRHCADQKMKSPEDVIMEVCNIEFRELYQNLMDYTGQRTPEDLKKAKLKSKAAPKRNMPAGHKQDHDKSISFLESCESSERFNIFDYHSVQYPSALPSKGGYPILPIVNEQGVIINCACISKKGLSFLSGGLSYGGWHTIPKNDLMNPDGIAWCTSVIRGLHHYWKTGQETRIVFDVFNLIWMINVKLINPDIDTLVINELENKQLPA